MTPASKADQEWTMGKLSKAIVIDVIHMRYEWLYQLGNLGISADEIKKRIKELQDIEARIDNDTSQ